MKNLHLPVVVALLAATLSAQFDRRLAYPQDTLTHSTGQIVPLGSFPGNPNFEEGRWQQLIPSTHLPQTAGIIVGLSFICQTYTGPIVYQSLRFTLGHTNATSLGTSFAGNLPVPIAVYNKTNHSVPWTGAQWSRIDFDVPFSFNGQDSLVFEIQKEATPIASGIATMARDGNPARSDLPRAVYTFGGVGSGAANATNSTATTDPLQVRLHWARTPSMFLLSNRLPSGTSQNVFGLGGTIEIGVDATAGSPYVTILAAGFVPPYVIPGTVGNAIVMPALLLPSGSVVGPGPGIQVLPIPLNPFLIDVYLTMQSAVLDVGIGGSIYLTNGVDLFIRTN